jgi:hypothetical protein
VRKSTKTAPAHSGGHASPAHPAKSQRTGITNLTKATAGAGSVIAARSSSSAAPKSSNAVTALNAPGGVYQTPILGGLLRQLTSN